MTSSNNDERETNFKIVFDGDDDKWQDFRDKFKAYGEYKKWWVVMKTAATSDEDEETQQLRKKARYALIMCTTGDAAAYVRADSDPFAGWIALMERYDNKDGNDLKSLYKEWDETMTEGPGVKDPKLWFMKLDEKEVEIIEAGGKQKDPSEMVAMVETAMMGLHEYKTVIQMIGMHEKRDELDFWKKQLFDFWKRQLKNKFVKKEADDAAYFTERGRDEGGKPGGAKRFSYKPFKGTCNKCGKVGHKGFQCRGAPTERNNVENRKCFKCHQRGHIARNCTAQQGATSRHETNTRPPTSRETPEAMFIGVTEEVNNNKTQQTKSWFEICEEESDDESYENVVMMIGEGDYESDAFCGSFFDEFGNNEPESDDDEAIYALTYDVDDEGNISVLNDDQVTGNIEETVMSIGGIPSRMTTNRRGVGPSDNAMWLLDTGATLHVTNDEGLLKDPIDIEKSITVGSGEVVSGIKQGWAEIKLGGDRRIRLQEVVYVPNFMKNILSVNRLCANGAVITIKKDEAILQSAHGDTHRVQRSRNGMFYLRDTDVAKYSKPRSQFIMETEEAKSKVPVIHVKTAHELLGHPSEKTTRATMGYYKIKVTGDLEICPYCATNKAAKKGSPKTAATKAELPCERLLVDTTGPFAPSLRGSLYDVYVMCQATNKRWIFNVKKKSEVTSCVEEVLIWAIGKGYKPQYLRCDNAGEHQKKLQNVCAKHGVNIEYTARNTPQQNGQVERAIATDRGRRNAMMDASSFTDAEKKLLRAEATQMVSQLAQFVVSANQPTPASHLLPTGTGLLQPKHLRKFGQVGYVTTKAKIQGKMKPRAKAMFMVGYANNHAPDTYRMYDPSKGSVVVTRDVTWTNGKKNAVPDTDHQENPLATTTPEINEPPATPHLIPDDDDDDLEPTATGTGRTATPTDRTEPPDPIPTAPPPAFAPHSGRMATRSTANNQTGRTPTQAGEQQTRLQRELARLQTAVNYEKDEERNNEVSDDDSDDDATVVALTDYIFLTADGEPKTLNEALNGPEAQKWIKSIKSEINNFLTRGAWEKHELDAVVAQGNRPIGTKTVFKIKKEHDGSAKYKMRIVSLGYNMKPGEHFHNSFSPVATDMSIRMLFAMGLAVMNEERSPAWKTVRHKERRRDNERYVRFVDKTGSRGRENLPACFGTKPDNPNPWVLEMFDVQAAFLNADPGVDVYIKVPEAMVRLGMITEEEASRSCFKLLKTMYGNVDAALRFFIKFKGILETLGFQQLQTDPCVFVKRDNKGTIVMMMATHVDDTLVSGRKKEIDEFYVAFERYLKIDRLGQVRKHLGVWWTFHVDSNDDLYLKADMEDMRKEIIDKFEGVTGKPVGSYQTPAMSNQQLRKNLGEPIKRTDYQSILGQLLYYTTKIAPPMSNAVRELSSHMSNPSDEHWKAMERTVGYLKGHGKYEFTLRAPEELRGIHVRDANYATCEETRRSVSGGVETLGGTIVGFSSKKQNVVSLSSAEAELISYVEGCQNARFTQQFLSEIIGYEPTAVIMEDNLGCIYLIKNQKTSSRTKHLAVRHLFGRDLYIANKVIPTFVRSEENISDGLTKNQPAQLFVEHENVLLNGILPYRREDVEEALRIERNNTERESKYSSRIGSGRTDSKRTDSFRINSRESNSTRQDEEEPP